LSGYERSASRQSRAGQKAVELPRHADKRLKAPENWKPSPVSDFARHPYMLMNLGQRDEPYADLSLLFAGFARRAETLRISQQK
jgi:hypothetical protein